jgi:hypothetical protein
VNVFLRLEEWCGRAVERTFAAAFPSAIEPVQIARKLVAAFEAGGSSSSRGGRRFSVHLSPADFARFAGDRAYLERQWTAMLARLLERSGHPERAPDVTTVCDASIASGTVIVSVESLPEPASVALHLRKGMPPDARAILERPTVIGRDPACDFVVLDPRVSRRHVVVEPDGAAFILRDLGSSNGTRLNGAPVERAELGLGDVITIGDSELCVEAGDA